MKTFSYLFLFLISCAGWAFVSLACSNPPTAASPKPAASTPTITGSPTKTFTVTNTPTITASSTHTATPTATASPTHTTTPTVTVTATSTCQGSIGTLTTSGYATVTGTSNTELFATELTVGSSTTAYGIEGAYECYISQGFQVAVYDSSGDIVVSSAQGTLPDNGSSFDYTLNFSPTVLSAGSYWVACMIQNTSGSNIGGAVQWPTNAGGGYSVGATWGSMPSSITPSESGSFSMELLTCP